MRRHPGNRMAFAFRTTGQEHAAAPLHSRDRLWTKDGMRRASRLIGLILFLAAIACSPVRIFNSVVPKEDSARLVARDMPFGPDKLQQLDIYTPTARDGAPLPVIVFLYGGSWSSGEKAGYGFVGRALAARGFLVLIPDYRKLPQVAYPAFLEDNAAAFRWARAHAADYGGDPAKMLLAGHSAGAYDGAMLLLDPRWLGEDRKAIRGFIGLAGPYDFLPLKGKILNKTFGAVADLRTTQPISYLAAGAPPVFLATGDKDRTVYPSNSDALERHLRAAGVPVERHRYPQVGHAGLATAIAKPLRGKAAVLDDMTAFAHRVTDSALLIPAK